MQIETVLKMTICRLKKQTLLKLLFLLILYPTLMVTFTLFFMKDQMDSYMTGRSTITSFYETPSNLEFPTITLCLDPATKLSVSKKYGFNNLGDKFYKDVQGSTLDQIFEEVTYKLNKDFQILSSLDSKPLNEGLTSITDVQNQTLYWFDLQKVRTFNNGMCYKLEPKFEVTEGFLRIKFAIVLNSTLQGLDKPKSILLYFTSNTTWIGIPDNRWPQFNPLSAVVHFHKEYTHFLPKVTEKYFKEGVEDNKKCLHEYLMNLNCSNHCNSMSFGNHLPPCKYTKDLTCMWKSMSKDESYGKCYMTKKATTYTLANRIENPFHRDVNESETEIFVGMKVGIKEVQQEILILTIQDLIGSVGGSLGMFFGFSISSTLIYLFDRVSNHCKFQ